jgi:hypothetical protein
LITSRARYARLGECVQELGRGLLWGLPLAAAAPLLALLGNIGLMLLPANGQWRRYPYNWQYCIGLILATAGIFGTVMFRSLTGDAHRASGDYCNGLYGWLTIVFGVDLVLCAAATVLGLWYTVRLLRD